tara:strand:- start:53 stop:736 length:684 start_codon:yes stop_codon:yes gene_type:complete
MPDTININQITKYVKFNKSAIKFNVNETANFVQPFIIPQRTEDPNVAFLDTGGSKMGTSKNILRYAEGEIVELPVLLEKFIDLNCFFTFGVKSDNTFIYSIIYAHDPGFRLLDGGDIERFLTDFKMNLLDSVSTTSEKVTGKAKVLKDINTDNYNTKEVILFLSQHLKRNILILDLNENKLTIYKDFNHDISSIVIVYSGKHYFPIANLMGEDIENNSCQLMIKHFQ